MMFSAIRVAMLVTDANERSSFTRCDPSRPSPVLHPAEENLLQGLRKIDGLEIEVIYAKANPLPEDFRKDLNCKFVPVPYSPVGVAGIRSYYLGRLIALRKYLRTRRYDVVHAQGTERECGLVASLIPGVSVITLHGNLTQIAKTLQAPRFSYFWTASLLETRAVKRVSGVHCISSHAMKCVDAFAKRTWIIPNSVAPSWYRVVRKPSTTPWIACVADITEWKNPIALVKASDAVRASFPEAELHFFGACHEQHPYAEAFLREIEARPWCVFHGKSSVPFLQDVLSNATCLVLPSKQENFGLVLAEAMAAGVPVLGADVGGIPDVIKNDITGLLFDPDDVNALGRVLVSLHLNPDKMNRLAAAGREEATSRFSIDVVADAHMKMYRQLAGMKS